MNFVCAALFRALSAHSDCSVTISKGETHLACCRKVFPVVLFRKNKDKKQPLLTELASHFWKLPSFCFEKCTVVQCSRCNFMAYSVDMSQVHVFRLVFSVSGRLQSVGPTHWEKNNKAKTGNYGF